MHSRSGVIVVVVTSASCVGARALCSPPFHPPPPPPSPTVFRLVSASDVSSAASGHRVHSLVLLFKDHSPQKVHRFPLSLSLFSSPWTALPTPFFSQRSPEEKRAHTRFRPRCSLARRFCIILWKGKADSWRPAFER